MRKHHPKNERIKRKYFTYLEEANRMSASSVDQVAAAIAQFEASTGHRDFAVFHIEQARKFKRQLADAINPAYRPAAREGDNLFAVDGGEGLLQCGWRDSRLQVASDLLGHGLFQSIQQ